MFKQSNFLRKFSNKACCSRNSPTKQSFVEIYHEGNFFVKIFHKGISNNVAAVLWKFFNKREQIFLYFSMNTVRHLERFLRQSSVNFGENFRKIHQSAEISTQQRCHAARVFVTLDCGDRVNNRAFPVFLFVNQVLSSGPLKGGGAIPS